MKQPILVKISLGELIGSGQVRYLLGEEDRSQSSVSRYQIESFSKGKDLLDFYVSERRNQTHPLEAMLLADLGKMHFNLPLLRVDFQGELEFEGKDVYLQWPNKSTYQLVNSSSAWIAHCGRSNSGWGKFKEGIFSNSSIERSWDGEGNCSVNSIVNYRLI